MSVCALAIGGHKNKKTERLKGKPKRNLICGQIVVIFFSPEVENVETTTQFNRAHTSRFLKSPLVLQPLNSELRVISHPLLKQDASETPTRFGCSKPASRS